MINYLILVITYIIAINFFSRKYKLLNHNISKQYHKKININNLIHTGGIYFLPIVLGILFYSKFKLNINLYLFNFFLIIIFLIGFLSDVKINFKPWLRLFIQIITFFFIVYFSDFLITRSGITIIDNLLNYTSFQYFFTIFCILVYINGLNFIDGINLNASGYLIHLFLSIIIVSNNTSPQLELINFVKFLLISLMVFYIFNFFFDNILGDSGIYVLGSITCFLVIYFVNSNFIISPILAINLLWYPAFENLFSIIRKILKKKDALKPDTYHFHTLVYKYNKLYFNNKSEKFIHNLSGIIMNIFFIPNTIISMYFFDSSIILFLNVLIYLILYLYAYYWLNKKIIKS